MNTVGEAPGRLQTDSAHALRFEPAPAPRGFTLVELLVVIAVIAILAGVLLPVLSKGKARVQTIDCIDHLRQLQLCWHMYAHDNDNVMTPNNFVYLVSPGSTNSVAGDTNVSWCRSLAPFDTNPISDTNSLLFYYNQNPAIYHCPADTSTVNGRPDLLRNRSFNMSNCINCKIDPNHFVKETEIRAPADLFVFIDTDADEITDPTFGVLPVHDYFQNYWLDIPADRHNTRSCNLTFADGHVETWKWNVSKGGRRPFTAAISGDDLEDLRRIQQHIKGAGGN
jgi:prepilin-type N-terminal cleavage/methylation domain-containing protein/prepilin-type processing-associated H-X9-DG protein